MPGTSDEGNLEPDLRPAVGEADGATGGAEGAARQGVGPVPGGVSDPTGGQVEDVPDDDATGESIPGPDSVEDEDPMEGQAPTG